MLSIPDPHEDVLPGALDAPGGFAWWYADLVDEAGNGLVLIPSWGLPFLPGRSGAARDGSASPARARPSLALSIYERGAPTYYLLQELRPEEVSRAGEAMFFGRSAISITPGRLRALLDLDAPGGRLVGEIVVEGVPRRPLGPSPLHHPDHEWCPLVGPAQGHWDLRAGAHRFAGRASAYLDRNAGRTGLSALGLARWTWARVQLPDRLRIGYALWPTEGEVQAVMVDVLASGEAEVHRASVEEGPTRRNRWGLPWWPRLRLSAGSREMAIGVRDRPDDGPAYLRHLCTVDTERGSALGIGEVCVTELVERDWLQPLVAMCVHRPRGPNSPLLPLFAGPMKGRLGRLLGAP